MTVLPFIECFPHTCSCARFPTYISSFNFHLCGISTLIAVFSTWGNWGMTKWSHLAKVSLLVIEAANCCFTPTAGLCILNPYTFKSWVGAKGKFISKLVYEHNNSCFWEFANNSHAGRVLFKNKGQHLYYTLFSNSLLDCLFNANVFCWARSAAFKFGVHQSHLGRL